MSNYTWLLDAGHGGLTPNGVYTTSPSKMHVFADGLTIYEGVNNRKVVDKLRRLLFLSNIDHHLIHEPWRDTPLKERVALANRLHAQRKNCIYLSIHSDAMPEGAHGKGSGFSVYTSIGNTASDVVAEIFCSAYLRRLPQYRFRRNLSDGDSDHEENFYVLKNTTCPALLVENLFFDNRREAEFLQSETGQLAIAMTLFNSIQETEKTRPI
jgi:N-acetylmuramoyl-L-alanine amidase